MKPWCSLRFIHVRPASSYSVRGFPSKFPSKLSFPKVFGCESGDTSTCILYHGRLLAVLSDLTMVLLPHSVVNGGSWLELGVFLGYSYSLERFPFEWGAVWSYLEFPHHQMACCVFFGEGVVTVHVCKPLLCIKSPSPIVKNLISCGSFYL